jgi:hypothetical protein
MADIRTLKLALLADTKDFIQGLDKADKETNSFSSKLGGALKKGAIAFAALGAAAGALAIKIGIDGVKAAIDDEKAQVSLAKTLENTTKATKDQIKSVEQYIDKTARATGVADDLLRPSLDRLVRSTKDVTKAQKLQQLALDISAGTGKDLATVSEALGKAYDGNLGALKRIGVPLSANIIATKDFAAAQEELAKTFGGQAAAQADTFAGKMARLKVALDEAKEGIGQALLPILEKLATLFVDKILPFIDIAVQKFSVFAESVTKNLDEPLNKVVDIWTNYVLPALQSLWSFIIDVWVPGVKAYFTPIIEGIVIAFNKVRDALARNEEKLKPLYEAFSVFVQWIATTGAPFIGKVFGLAFQALGVYISAVIDIIAGIVDAIDKAIKTVQNFIDKIKEAIDFAQRIPVVGNLIPGLPSGAPGKGGTVINNSINIKGVLNPQGAAREIVKIQNTGFKTTGIKPMIPGR